MWKKKNNELYLEKIIERMLNVCSKQDEIIKSQQESLDILFQFVQVEKNTSSKNYVDDNNCSLCNCQCGCHPCKHSNL